MQEDAEPMEHEREHADDQATSVNEPSGEPADAGAAYDPTMTDADEANIPADSTADPDRD